MKKSIFFAASLAALALISCNKKEQVEPEAAPEYITVSTTIGGLTRVSTEGTTAKFDEGDKISVYAWTGTADEVNTAKLVVNNSTNILKAGKWEPTPMMKWADMVTPHYFLSVYPARAITDFKADPITVDPARQEDSDLLVATNLGDSKQGLTATNNSVALKFDHMMSKLVVKLEYRNEFATTPNVSSTFTSAKTVGTIDYLSGTFTTSGTASDYQLQKVTDNKEYASVLIPQTIQTITVVIDGRNFIYNHPTPLSLCRRARSRPSS